MGITEDDFLASLNQHVKHKYGSMSAASKKWGVSAMYVSLICRGLRTPPDWLLDELGYQRETLVRYYKRRRDI